LTAVAQLVPSFALSWALPGCAALAAGSAVALGTSLRFRRLAHDRKRSRSVTRLLDEPLFCHWGAGLISVPLFALGLIGGTLALGAPAAGVALASYASALSISAWSVWGLRRRVRIREIELSIAGLDPAFDGYRVAHLTDLHIGSFARKEQGQRWAELANSLDADLAVVTGDLVSSGTAFHDDVADVLGALRARDGVVVSLGNHDQWDAARLTGAIEARGPRVLANAWLVIRRGAAELVIAGLGDHYTGNDDLDQSLRDRPPAPTLLLSHYPHFFEAAAERGVQLVLSGHTHGGQIGLPFFADRFNVATLGGQRARGLYRRGESALYVNAGLGTTGPPMRLGIPPEIALLVLRAARASATMPAR
jgi:uncharacterized protein